MLKVLPLGLPLFVCLQLPEITDKLNSSTNTNTVLKYYVINFHLVTILKKNLQSKNFLTVECFTENIFSIIAV